MYIRSNNEIDKRINVSKITNDISTMGDNSTAGGCNSRLINLFIIIIFLIPQVVKIPGVKNYKS